MCVTCPHVHLGLEPAGIIQAGRSDRNELRNGIGFDHDRRATVRAKASASHAAPFAGRRMKAGRALQDGECFRRYDDVRRKRAPGGSLTITAVTVKHCNRCGSGLIPDRATSAATGERSCWAHSLFVSFRRLAPVLGKVRVTNLAGSRGPVGMSSCSSEGCMAEERVEGPPRTSRSSSLPEALNTHLPFRHRQPKVVPRQNLSRGLSLSGWSRGLIIRKYRFQGVSPFRKNGLDLVFKRFGADCSGKVKLQKNRPTVEPGP